MLEIRPCADDADLERSLAIYNAVFPSEAVTMDEVHSFISQALDYGDFLGPGGSVAVGVMPERPDVAFVMLAVLPDHRRHGLGTALYREVSAWLAERGVHRIDVPVHEDDEEAIAFAERRGFQEVERNRRMILDLPSSIRLRSTRRPESRSSAGRNDPTSPAVSTRSRARPSRTSRAQKTS